MDKAPSLDSLWSSTPAGTKTFDPSQLAHLPKAVRRYLEHAIVPGMPLANAVRLRMRGEIKLKQNWCPFTAEQVIRNDGQMLWEASVKMYYLPVQGYDRLVEGQGAMQWKLLGLIPIINASGQDITRSTVGRVAGEFVWLPTALCVPTLDWAGSDAAQIQVRLPLQKETVALDIATDLAGHPQTVHLSRWGNPDNAGFRYADFGGVVEEENSFGGYTIPTRLRIGWGFRDGKFAADGEFIRVRIDDAAFR